MKVEAETCILINGGFALLKTFVFYNVLIDFIVDSNSTKIQVKDLRQFCIVQKFSD